MLSVKNKHQFDYKIKFQDEGHKYWINGDNKNVISVTEFYKKFFPEFETKSDEIINAIINSEKYKDPDYKYHNMSAEAIKKSWKNIGNEASDLGKQLHKDIEDFYNSREEHFENDNEIVSKQFAQFYEDHKHIKIYRTEWLVFVEKLKLAGAIDAVFKNEDGTYSIYDWKRSKEIKYESEDDGKYPFEHLPNVNFSHYSLQLNIYREILEKYYDFRIKDMFIIVFHPNNEGGKYQKIKIEKMEREVRFLFEYRKNEINKIEFEIKNVEEEKTNMFTILSDKQKEAYTAMIKRENVLLTGRAGSGKSMLIKMFYKEHRFSRTIAITSTTGVSALLIGGTTLHSYLGIGLGKDEVDALYMKILSNSKLTKKWRDLDVLIVDEISMMSPELFDKLEQLARLLRKNSAPFGGIQLVLVGDFLQLPCVSSDEFCFQSKTWDKCISKVIYLSEIFRQDDVTFQNCLNEIRIGELSEHTIEVLQSRVGVELKNEFGIIPTKIYSLNRNVDKENEKELNKLFVKDPDLEFFEYELEFNILDKKRYKVLQEKISKICIAPQTLQLCVGAQVMLLYNIDLECGLANGSRGVIMRFQDDLPVVKFLNGIERMIDFQDWKLEEQGETLMIISQIPLKVAYACSVHKTQGITLDYAIIDLNDVFEYGQAYVALSRVKTLQGLSLKNFIPEKIFAHPAALKFYKRL